MFALFQLLRAYGHNVHVRFRNLMICMILLAVLAIVFNLIAGTWEWFWWLKIVNVCIGVITAPFALYFLTHPDALLAIFGLGAISNQSATAPADMIKNSMQGGKNLLLEAVKTVSTFFVFYSSFFMIAGKLDFTANPEEIPTLILALIVVSWIAAADWFKTKFYRKVIYAMAYAVVIWTILSYVDSAIFIRVIGRDPFVSLRTNPVDTGVAAIEKAERIKKQKAMGTKLKVIEQKIKDSEKGFAGLSLDDQLFFRRKQRERDAGKWIGSGSGNAEASTKSENVKPLDKPMGTYPINKTAGQIDDNWMQPQGRLHIVSPDNGCLLLTPSGTKIPCSEVETLYRGEPVKFYAITDQLETKLVVDKDWL